MNLETVAALVVIVTAVVTALVGSSRYLRRPRLVVFWDSENTKDLRRARSGLLCWFHVQVQNWGARPAKNCQGHLTRFEVYKDPGGFELHPDWVGSSQLQWANLNFAVSINLPGFLQSDRRHRLDFFVIPLEQQVLSLVSPVQHVGLPVQFGPGRYRATVSVEADNAQPAARRFEISFTGTHEDTEVCEVP